MRNALRDKFMREGFIVHETKNGAEGLEVARHEHPDVILLDLVMPVMDGIAMLKKLRADPWGMDAKVIILTNLNDNAKLAEALAQGSHHYLVKANWKIEDVVGKVKEVLGENNTSAHISAGPGTG